jgi:outer membrane protein assembly factor BamB
VIWGRHVFLTAADNATQKVFCFDRADGKLLWERKVQSLETMRRLDAGSEEGPAVFAQTGYAASTPVTDGQRLYALFATADIAALDFTGKVLWVRNMGTPKSAYGLASSLALSEKTVIFQFDQEEGLSQLIGLDDATGFTAWQTPRPVTASWCSPIVVEADGRKVIVTSGDPWVIAYDAETGSELWRCKELSLDVAPSPVYADGMVFVADEGAEAMAIRMGGEGDVTQTHVAWRSKEGLPDVASPLCDGRFFLEAGATSSEVTCLNAATGALVWQERLPSGLWASPALAGDVVYVFDDGGRATLFRLADKYQRLAENRLDEPVYASPAFCDGRIFVRGEKHLFCIGVKP